MKELGFALLLALILAAGINAAHASLDDCMPSFSLSPGGSDDSFGCKLLDITSAPTFASMTTSMIGMKEAYIGQVQDEAADFLAADGKAAAGAELAEVIQKIRSQDVTAAKLTDTQISGLILGSKANF